MNSFLISLFCIVLISSIISLILPEGKIGKIINVVLSFLVLSYFLSPIININFDDLNIQIDSGEVVYQDDYLHFIKSKKDQSYQLVIKTMLEDKSGIETESVYIVSDYDEKYKYNILSVDILLKNSELFTEENNINIIDEIEIDVSERLNIDKESVKVKVR